MKKFVSGIIIGVMISITMAYAAASLTAMAVTFPVYVNGTLYKNINPAVTINNTTYMPVKVLGDAFGVKVVFNDEKKCLEIGEPQKQTPQSSYSNPTDINTTLVFNYEGYTEKYKVEVTLKELVRGEQAWQMIVAANKYNDPAPDGYEYLLARINFKVLEINDGKAFNLDAFDFDLISTEGKEYESASVVEPEPELQASLYRGASHEGWVGFLVRKNDLTPKITFGRDYDGTGGIWFKGYASK